MSIAAIFASIARQAPQKGDKVMVKRDPYGPIDTQAVIVKVICRTAENDGWIVKVHFDGDTGDLDFTRTIRDEAN